MEDMAVDMEEDMVADMEEDTGAKHFKELCLMTANDILVFLGICLSCSVTDKINLLFCIQVFLSLKCILRTFNSILLNASYT